VCGICGTVAGWQHGFIAIWLCGRVAAWQRGSMAAGQHGSGAAWQHGSMAARQHGSINSQNFILIVVEVGLLYLLYSQSLSLTLFCNCKLI
jgi:hypothetical protein